MVVARQAKLANRSGTGYIPIERMKSTHLNPAQLNPAYRNEYR